jgi:hypothetical protein
MTDSPTRHLSQPIRISVPQSDPRTPPSAPDSNQKTPRPVPKTQNEHALVAPRSMDLKRGSRGGFMTASKQPPKGHPRKVRHRPEAARVGGVIQHDRHVDLTSGWRTHQVKQLRKESRSKVGSLMLASLCASCSLRFGISRALANSVDRILINLLLIPF